MKEQVYKSGWSITVQIAFKLLFMSYSQALSLHEIQTNPKGLIVYMSQEVVVFHGRGG